MESGDGRAQAAGTGQTHTRVGPEKKEEEADSEVIVRRAVAGDEPILRALRLRALTDSPAAFGSTYERELARTTADWQRWLTPGATFIVEAGEESKGIV